MNQEVAALCRRIRDLTPASVERPTLVYFDIIGIAWPIRCLLHLAAVDHELVQISIFQWFERDEQGRQALKGVFTNGHVPLYVDEEVSLNQSQIILTYLAERHGMDGQTARERLAVREVMAHAYDALFHCNGMLSVTIRNGLSDEIAEARLGAFLGEGEWPLVSDGYDNHLRGFDRYLSANPASSGFFVGHSLTVADLHAFNVLCNWYKAFSPARFVEDYPRLEDFIQRIAAIPGVTDYITHEQEPTTWFPLPTVAMRLTSPAELEGLTAAR